LYGNETNIYKHTEKVNRAYNRSTVYFLDNTGFSNHMIYFVDFSAI